MSFRNRLTLFFVVIVIVPMVAVALVLFRLVADSETGKGDARLGQAQRAAQGLFANAQDRGEEAARTIGSSADLAEALRDRDRDRIQSELADLAGRSRVSRLRADLDGLGTFEVGSGAVVAPVSTRLVDARGEAVGRLRLSLSPAARYAREVRRATELAVVIDVGDRVVASTLEGQGPRVDLPLRGDVTVGGADYRVAGFRAAAFEGGEMTVRLFALGDGTDALSSTTSIVVAAALFGFLLLAFAFALVVSRSLQAQIQRLLDAARRVGGGDFGIEVPTEGNDEFAALAHEFNSMASQLERRIEELGQERGRLQDAIRRVGESFAKGLDRDALLGIIVQTAVDGIGADCGRATVVDEDDEASDRPPPEVARAGDLGQRKEALHAVEAAVLRTGEPSELDLADAYALGRPLRGPDSDRVLGIIAVARGRRPFSAPERELFAYLAQQAGVSMENVDLHETVQRQAVEDELTGLSNHRRFQEVMALEIERARRYEQGLGLVMLDLDNFKRVNDTYGHMQGDLVLREVAKVLRESAREIDETARYGGEEMAVVLPQTDLEGTFHFAERLRASISALSLPILEADDDERLRVTASFGVAALGPHGEVVLGEPDGEVREGESKATASEREALVGAADAALYRAKRSGKNRTVRAE